MDNRNFQDPHYHPPKLPKLKDSFRILSFNMAHGRAQSLSQFLTPKQRIIKNCVAIKEFLKTTEADFVMLQEIDFQAAWTNHLNQRALVNADDHFPFAHEGQNNQSSKWFKMDYGNSILSKHEILSHQNYPFDLKRMGGKGFQLAKIKWQNKDISIINVHLDPYSNKSRDYQLKTLQDVMVSTGETFIIGGDFNMTIDDPILKEFINRLNLDHPVNESHSYQFLNWKKRLDYIFATPDIQWLQTEIIKTKLSDHSPLYQDFKWK